jgi:hypothetical protein
MYKSEYLVEDGQVQQDVEDLLEAIRQSQERPPPQATAIDFIATSARLRFGHSEPTGGQPWVRVPRDAIRFLNIHGVSLRLDSI